MRQVWRQTGGLADWRTGGLGDEIGSWANGRNAGDLIRGGSRGTELRWCCWLVGLEMVKYAFFDSMNE